MKKFATKLTNAQIAFARECEASGLTTYSQAVKRLERGEGQSLRSELRKRSAMLARIAELGGDVATAKLLDNDAMLAHGRALAAAVAEAATEAANA